MTTPFPPSLRRGRLLLVDDRPENIRLMHQILASEYEIFAATGGQQAIDLCATALPDLILLDVFMPGMDGLEVCRRLKQNPATESIAVIFVTAGSQTEEENACWQVGAADFVNKPVNPLTLRNRVRAHWQLKLHVDALHAMAHTDGLTAIANRRYLNERLEAECQRCQRSGLPLSLLMIDVDFFKRYNDRYGHPAGDECLKRVAGALQAALQRPFDLAARYGGEEFVCLLPDTDAAGALAMADKVEAAVRALGLEHADSTVDAVVTVSIGVAAVATAGLIDSQALLRRADQALYRAKTQGRGRACLAPEAEQPA
ncbi:diguanylate cyclase [Rugamonas sp. DEMB1]|uniref:diguanylate cyclase n=1 Tax=Rugamonas sp. DEMB1 TaxID=3039386 RepID=UPI0024469533|nr:diguanylate cyclase [Rugamonas sp. DEMB1]WGG49588.1 diguanylate cyclase [Rugamonas sp. DEMB1]